MTATDKTAASAPKKTERPLIDSTRKAKPGVQPPASPPAEPSGLNLAEPGEVAVITTQTPVISQSSPAAARRAGAATPSAAPSATGLSHGQRVWPD